MIVIETKLKVLPKKCNKCRYSYFNYGDRFCAVSFVSFKDGLNRSCPYEYNKAKRNYEYGKPDWCPLTEINSTESYDPSEEGEVWSTNPWNNYEKQGATK